jgi:hypothetical protein
MSKLFQSSQGSDESVAEWSCRVEVMVSRIQASGELPIDMANNMKRDRLWCGLRSKSMKTATQHWYDNKAVSFENLMLAIRRVDEMDNCAEQEAKPKKVTSQQVQSSDDKMDLILKQLQSMSNEIKVLKEQQARKPQYNKQRSKPQSTSADNRGESQFHGQCWTCGQSGHRKGSSSCPGKA